MAKQTSLTEEYMAAHARYQEAVTKLYYHAQDRVVGRQFRSSDWRAEHLICLALLNNVRHLHKELKAVSKQMGKASLLHRLSHVDS